MRTLLLRSFQHLLLAVCGFTTAFPFLWMISTSLKTPGEVGEFPPRLLPATPQWSNYPDAWQSAAFPRYFANSVVMATVVTLGVVVTALLAGYAFGHMEFPGRKIVFMLYLATMMIPFEVVLIPNYLFITRLGWYNSLAALVAPWLSNVFSVFLVTQFFRGLPRDFYEAAQLDGCGHGRYLSRIAAPLARPALATAGLFAFLGSWNSLLWPLLVTNSDAMRPIEVGLQSFLVQEGPRPHLLMAASTMAMAPIIGLFFLAQKTFVEGVAAGVKG